MRIGIIGAGNVATTLGSGWRSTGHTITYGTRDPASGAPPAGTTFASIRDACSTADLVVLATPWAAVAEALAAAGDLTGKPLVDLTNPIGPGFTLALGHTTSGAEYVATLAKGARVVKAFNTTGLENMAAPGYGSRRLVMPVAGDDRAAVELAVTLATDLGFEAVALPALARARELEPVGLLWVKLALQWGHGRGIGFSIGRRLATDRPTAARTAAPQRITIVGSGRIGGALARGWLRAGHQIAIAVRDSDAAEVRELVSLGATTTPMAGAADRADVVVLAVPYAALAEVTRAIGSLDGKIVVDCTNAIGRDFALTYGLTTSSAEELAKTLPGARVVRSFHQQGAETLDNPSFSGAPATNFVAGDDAAARAVVAGLAVDLGLDAVEVGPLASARYLEPITLLWIAMAKAIGARDVGLSLLRR